MSEYVDDDLTAGLLALAQLRRDIFARLDRYFASESHCKSYEGVLTLQMPSYFYQRPPYEAIDEGWTLELHCYVIGPSRHYRWTAPSLRALVGLAGHDIRSWIQQDENNEENYPPCESRFGEPRAEQVDVFYFQVTGQDK